MQSSSCLMQNSSFWILTCRSEDVRLSTAGRGVPPAKFRIFVSFLYHFCIIFDTNFLVFDTKFITFTHCTLRFGMYGVVWEHRQILSCPVKSHHDWGYVGFSRCQTSRGQWPTAASTHSACRCHSAMISPPKGPKSGEEISKFAW